MFWTLFIDLSIAFGVGCIIGGILGGGYMAVTNKDDWFVCASGVVLIVVSILAAFYWVAQWQHQGPAENGLQVGHCYAVGQREQVVATGKTVISVPVKYYVDIPCRINGQ
jgi:hypothetical protein